MGIAATAAVGLLAVALSGLVEGLGVDAPYLARLVVEDRLEDQAYTSLSGPITALDIIFGHTASLARGNTFMAHRTGFTARTLQKVLTEARFVGITVRRGSAFDLWATAFKPAAVG